MGGPHPTLGVDSEGSAVFRDKVFEALQVSIIGGCSPGGVVREPKDPIESCCYRLDLIAKHLFYFQMKDGNNVPPRPALKLKAHKPG